MRLLAAATLLLAFMFSGTAQASWVKAPTMFGPAIHKADRMEFSDRRKKAKRAKVVRSQKVARIRRDIVVCDRQGCRDGGAAEAREVSRENVFHRYVERNPVKGASRACLTAETRAVLNRLEARFGAVKVISTCRPGATIAGTRKPSYHRYGMAVDFNVPKGVSKQAMVRWLYDNNKGVVMTYKYMGHIHFDTGSYHTIACGGCGKSKHRKPRRAYAAAH